MYIYIPYTGNIWRGKILLRSTFKKYWLGKICRIYIYVYIYVSLHYQQFYYAGTLCNSYMCVPLLQYFDATIASTTYHSDNALMHHTLL